MNLDNVKYSSILIKIKDNKSFEFELRKCESVTEVTLQKMMSPLLRKLREVKQTAVAAKNAEIRKQQHNQKETIPYAAFGGLANKPLQKPYQNGTIIIEAAKQTPRRA